MNPTTILPLSLRTTHETWEWGEAAAESQPDAFVGTPLLDELEASSGPLFLGIDPGPAESALATIQGQRVWTVTEPNEALLHKLRSGWFQRAGGILGIEMLSGSYGQACGLETMMTAVWVGRFAEAWEHVHGAAAGLIFRKTAVTHVTNNPKANDSHVRQALVDRYGGDSVALAKPKRCEACKGKGFIPARKAQAPCDQPCADCRCSGMVGREGPLRGVSGHSWAALCIAVSVEDAAASSAPKGRTK